MSCMKKIKCRESDTNDIVSWIVRSHITCFRKGTKFGLELCGLMTMGYKFKSFKLAFINNDEKYSLSFPIIHVY